MRGAVVTAGLLFVVGCQGVEGPFARRERPPVFIDAPGLTIEEQEKRGRDRVGLPEKSPDIAPRTGAEEPYYRRMIVR
jgi:hypothetical protein